MQCNPCQTKNNSRTKPQRGERRPPFVALIYVAVGLFHIEHHAHGKTSVKKESILGLKVACDED